MQTRVEVFEVKKKKKNVMSKFDKTATLGIFIPNTNIVIYTKFTYALAPSAVV